MITNRKLTTEMYIEVKAEVERLKKDFGGQLDKAKRAGQYAFNNGLVEGERRAMKRVKETIYKVSKEIYWEGTANEGKKQILRTLLDELGLGEESTDNNNYTNKGSK